MWIQIQNVHIYAVRAYNVLILKDFTLGGGSSPQKAS